MPPVPHLVDTLFNATLAALVLLHVIAYAAPDRIVRLNALPWAFRVDFNTDLDFQSVTYAAVHESWQARWSHLTLPLEALAWAVLLYGLHPGALVACTVFLAFVFSRMPERPFAIFAFVCWVGLSVLAGVLVHMVGFDFLGLPAKVLLLAAPTLRVLGHAFDPIPPFVGVPRDAFVPMREAGLGPRILLVVAAGWLSECAASLPYRLFWVQLFWAAQQAGYRPRSLRPWSDTAALGARIRAEGWKAYDGTARLFANRVEG